MQRQEYADGVSNVWSGHSAIAKIGKEPSDLLMLHVEFFWIDVTDYAANKTGKSEQRKTHCTIGSLVWSSAVFMKEKMPSDLPEFSGGKKNPLAGPLGSDVVLPATCMSESILPWPESYGPARRTWRRYGELDAGMTRKLIRVSDYGHLLTTEIQKTISQGDKAKHAIVECICVRFRVVTYRICRWWKWNHRCHCCLGFWDPVMC